MGPRVAGGWAGTAGAPAPGWTCLLPLLLCAMLRSLLASPGSEGERGWGGRTVGAAPTEEGRLSGGGLVRAYVTQLRNILGEVKEALLVGSRIPRREKGAILVDEVGGPGEREAAACGSGSAASVCAQIPWHGRILQWFGFGFFGGREGGKGRSNAV